MIVIKVFELDVDWPDKLNIFFNTRIFHRPQYLSFSYCTTNDSQVYFFMFLPIGFVVLLCIMGGLTFYFGIQRRALKNNHTAVWIQTNVANLRTNVLRIMLLFCLTIFPIVTSEFLLFFDCRDFGVHGSYLRKDYSVECFTENYYRLKYLAIFGILVFGVGIPVFFYYVVRNREKEMFANSSIVLHRSFKDYYKQFEIVALFHKVLLFSLVAFVARPGTSSQCLFLLMCNLVYLAILGLCQPYEFYTDTILALSFTSIECFAFLVAFLVISGVANVEEYSMDDIYNVLYSLLIIAVCLLTPTLYAMKFDNVNAMVLRKTGIAVNRVRQIARRSTRRSSAFLSTIRSSAESNVSLYSFHEDETRIRKSTLGDSAHINLELSPGDSNLHARQKGNAMSL